MLAEHPKIGIITAARISFAITSGHKKDLFFLDLSFLGWTMFFLVTGGLVFLWLIPYRRMTLINAYDAMKHESLVMGKQPH